LIDFQSKGEEFRKNSLPDKTTIPPKKKVRETERLAGSTATKKKRMNQSNRQEGGKKRPQRGPDANFRLIEKKRNEQ